MEPMSKYSEITIKDVPYSFIQRRLPVRLVTSKFATPGQMVGVTPEMQGNGGFHFGRKPERFLVCHPADLNPSIDLEIEALGDVFKQQVVDAWINYLRYEEAENERRAELGLPPTNWEFLVSVIDAPSIDQESIDE